MIQPTLIFSYDGLGNRMRKVQVARDASGNTLPMAQWDITYYIRDAQGNHLTTIDRKFIETDTYEATDRLSITETVMYGSDRLGTRTTNPDENLLAQQAFTHSGANEFGEYQDLTPTGDLELNDAPTDLHNSYEGAKHYELKNHLGNVLATVSDKRDVEVDASYNVESYTAKVSNVSFYYPFGSLMPEISDFGGGHRFGFQGQQKDNEVRNVNGGHITFKYRPYNPDLGRFWSVDPLTRKYPFYSPFAFSGNRVIDAIELEGLEPKEIKTNIPSRIEDLNKHWGYGGKAGGSDKNNWTVVVNGNQIMKIVQCTDCLGPNGEQPLIWYHDVAPLAAIPIVEVPPPLEISGTLDSHKPLNETVGQVVNAAKGLVNELKDKFGQDSKDVSSVHVQLPEVLSSQLRGPVKDALNEEFPNAHVSVWGSKETETSRSSSGQGGTAESTPFQVSIQGSPKTSD
jgi:RHS repeat-associated protein